MADSSKREERERVRRAVEIAYFATARGASSDDVLCSDERRTRFDQFVQIACRYNQCSVTPEQARRTLINIRKSGKLIPSVDTVF